MQNQAQSIAQIDEKLLIEMGASLKTYTKGEVIFQESEFARYYYQIVEGCVKMFNINDEGKEFTQGIFEKGQCFGEPPLFINEPYPASAISTCETCILKLSKELFFQLLNKVPEVQRKMLDTFATRIYNKAISSREIVNNTPELRILGFLKTYKKRNCIVDQKIHIPYTRQDIANFTGLRVETVIRTLSKMKDDNKVEIINRKLVY